MNSTKLRNWETKELAFGCVHPGLCLAGDALMAAADAWDTRRHYFDYWYPSTKLHCSDSIQHIMMDICIHLFAQHLKTPSGWIVEIHLFGQSVFYHKAENIRYLVFQPPLKLRTSYVTYIRINQRCTLLIVLGMTQNSFWWQNSRSKCKKIIGW